MNSRAKLILKIATFTQAFDNDQPLSTQNIQDAPELNTLALLYPNPLCNDSLDTNSIPDSQPDLSLLEEEGSDIMTRKVVGPSDSSSNS